MSQVTLAKSANICPAKVLKDVPNTMPENFVRPDLPSKCTWTVNKQVQKPSPHTKRPL